MRNCSPALLTVALLVTAASPCRAPAWEGGVEPAAGGGYSGKVTQTMDAGRYTYVEVDIGEKRIWAAAPAFEVKIGDTVSMPRGMPMQKFHSKELDRDFEVVHFMSMIRVGEAAAAPTGLPAGHPGVAAPGAAGLPELDLTGIEKPEGGLTVEEIFAQTETPAGTQVVVRGRVVKFLRQIIGRNWVHIQDGSGEEGSNDITVTTQMEVQRGDLVTVTGTLARDRDFGHGYKYAVLLEDAALQVEELQFPPSRLATRSGKHAAPDSFYEAADCGECHVEQHEQWMGSAHQVAHSDGIYTAFAQLARKEGGEGLYVFCSSCHAPLAVSTGEIPDKDASKQTFLSHDGVSCEACHTASEVLAVHGGAGANASLVLEEGDVRYGPRHDAEENDAHESALSLVHTRSMLCSACHTLTHPGNGLIIENTYTEWQRGPYAAAGIECQDCHMRTVAQAQQVARVMRPIPVPGKTWAEGKERADVHAHLFAGANVNSEAAGIGAGHAAAAEQRLKGAASLALQLPAKAKPGRTATIGLSVSNVSAGHAIPTSITELREVWIELVVKDGNGATIYTSGMIREDGSVDPTAVMYHAVLHDADGKVTYLPWRAVKMVKEHLIPPKQTVTESFAVAVPKGTVGPLEVSARLRYRSAPQNVMDELFGKGTFVIKTVNMASTTGRLPVSRWGSLWKR